MTVINPATGQQAIDNSLDVQRRWPDTSQQRTSTKLTGPDAVGAAPANVINLPEAAVRIVNIQSVVTATGAAGAILAPIEGTHYLLVNGGTQLRNPSAVDFTLETWTVEYDRASVAGGNSQVTPGP